ncbi:quinate transport [Fusarium albosuccineum]|uniref:Quinate transport n=1 Tax=Fusarium albosuccineum TaxID=1237068 RepID=A0A8H4PCH8_9HYPO|nr:quinate transport [Fusarium albosuccineum]
MVEQNSTDAAATSDSNRKRARQPASDPRYPRKRSLRACHVCRARKTKCDNAQPTCGFCASLNIPCSYDTTEKDHSSFDPASLEILRQLNQIISSQDDLMQIVRSVAASQSQCAPPDLSPSAQTHASARAVGENVGWDSSGNIQTQQLVYVNHDWSGPQTDSASTTPAASASVAAVRWFGLLANDAPPEALQEADVPLSLEGGLLDPSVGQDESDMTPLQRATRIIDSQPIDPELPEQGTATEIPATSLPEESLWQASENISLLDKEQLLFEKFLHQICSWLDLFDPAHMFATRVPHLAVRNAGLLNAILALSCYHQSLDESINAGERPDQNSALQYYYQTLHYVQKAMRYSTYQNSQELMATTLIVSTYEMLRGSRKDWQQHLQGVFWILRSRQIEVETSSLESTTWWAWLRQDIWVAFREKRRTYSTWTPKKGYTDLSSHELASRAVWILAQVVNFCAVDSSEEAEVSLPGRIGWAKALKKMLHEWRSNLTVEFSPLPAMSRQSVQVFQPRLIYPQCFGSYPAPAVDQFLILVCAHEPCLGGLETFMKRQSTIKESIEMVCGLGMTLTEDASSMLSSQCLFMGKALSSAADAQRETDSCSWNVYAESASAKVRGRDAGLVPKQVRLADALAEFRAGADLGQPSYRLGKLAVIRPAQHLHLIGMFKHNLYLSMEVIAGSRAAPDSPRVRHRQERRGRHDKEPNPGFSSDSLHGPAKMTVLHSMLRRIVRNDAIHVDPPEVYNWRVLTLAASACFAGALFGVDAGIIGGVLAMPDFKREFGLDSQSKTAAADLSGNLVTTMQAGAVAGALVCSPFADRWGRKPALLAVAVTGFIGGIMQAFSYGHLSAFYIGRFIEGIGLGAGTMLAPTYVAENSPRAIRGFLVGFFQLLLVMGGMTAYFINYGSLLHLPGKATWMVPLACQSICPALLFFSMLFCPESPRWLATQDQWDKAGSVLSNVRKLPLDHAYVQQELLELRTQLDQEREIMQGTGFWNLQKECWTIPGNRKRALMTIGIITFQQWSGTGAINYYAPTIFRDLGLSSTTTALFAQGVYGIVKVVTCLIFIFFLADSLGRRISFMWSGFVQAFCMLFLGFYVRFGPKIGDNETPPPSGIAALAMVYIFAAAFNMGWGPVSWVYVSEIPTNRLRAYNVALASLTHWVHNLAVSRATPNMLVTTPYGAYFIFGSINFTMAIVAYWIPETKGISLERMDEVFGVADFSNIEDVGQAARHAKSVEEEDDHHTPKV